MHDDLLFLHKELRKHLDAACAKPGAPGPRVGQILLDLVSLERSIAEARARVLQPPRAVNGAHATQLDV